jgi:tRNA threonylcarbamoyladenosine biosynthesis protein TsaB
MLATIFRSIIDSFSPRGGAQSYKILLYLCQMHTLLHIETSTDLCSVALSDAHSAKPLYSFVSDKRNEHSSTLMLYIEEALKQTGITFKDLSAIATGIGPGSYTGLRIGAATAKGLAYSLNIPIIGISPLQAMAHCVINRREAVCGSTAQFVPMLDAGRMEVYTAVYGCKLNEIMPVQALILTPDAFADLALQHTLVFFGNGSDKFRSIMPDKDRHIFIDGIAPAASLMIPLAAKEYAAGNFLDTAYFEPLYIKEFIAKTPNVKGLQ